MSSSGIIGLDTNQSGETMETRSTTTTSGSTASRSDIITIGGYEYHIGNASEEQIKMLYKLHNNNNGGKTGGGIKSDDYENVEVVDMNDDDEEDQYEDEPTTPSTLKMSTGIIFGKSFPVVQVQYVLFPSGTRSLTLILNLSLSLSLSLQQQMISRKQRQAMVRNYFIHPIHVKSIM